MTTTARCSKCQEFKPSDQFSPDARKLNGLSSHCRPCHRLVEYASKARNFRRVHLKAQYGITPEEYLRIEEEQGGICAICSAPPPPKRAKGSDRGWLDVDHCHETGEIRG